MKKLNPVVGTDTCAQPNAVVVEAIHASVALSTVMRFRRSVNVAGVAVLQVKSTLGRDVKRVEFSWIPQSD